MQIHTTHHVGQMIREHRKSAGLSQRALAEKAGVTQKWIWEIEQGKPAAELRLVLHVLQVLGAPVTIPAPWERSGLPDEAGDDPLPGISSYPDISDLVNDDDDREGPIP